jgi:hypothetical protein
VGGLLFRQRMHWIKHERMKHGRARGAGNGLRIDLNVGNRILESGSGVPTSPNDGDAKCTQMRSNAPRSYGASSSTLRGHGIGRFGAS